MYILQTLKQCQKSTWDSKESVQKDTSFEESVSSDQIKTRT